jgi:hypothetical protein
MKNNDKGESKAGLFVLVLVIVALIAVAGLNIAALR